MGSHICTPAFRAQAELMTHLSSALQRDTVMSQRGRSGFLSYLLLLSRVLRFEHRVEEVVGTLGLLSRIRA